MSSLDEGAGGARRPRRAVPVLAAVIAAVVVAILHVQVVQPWSRSWGSTAEDRALALPGDELVPNAEYQTDHVVRVNAPPEAVWPWLVQVGQDRAGFYSYHWLENIFLAGILKREEIRPEWQERAPGDFVPAVQSPYLGMDAEGLIGWRVSLVEPNAALGLQDWGTFALVPSDDGSTRLIARQRGNDETPPQLWPLVTYFLDPAHFVMERRMLLHLQDLAEGRQEGVSYSLANAGWLLGAGALAGFFVLRRRWISLAASVAVAALVWFVTGDPAGALAAYMGLGLALLGLALFGWWAGLWIVLLGTATFLVLALARDAWVVFGLAFGVCAVAFLARVVKYRGALASI